MNYQNVSELISEVSKKYPEKTSIKMAKKNLWGGYKYPSYSFSKFETRVNQFAQKFEALGVKPQDKVLFFVKPNLDFSAITYALFRMGAIVIFIDPGMKREYFFEAIKEVNPDVLIGIPKVHLARRLHSDVFKSIRLYLTTGLFGVMGSRSIYSGLKKYGETVYSAYIPKKDDLAAILYTSGGTGRPKGVAYTHDIFINQTKMLQKEFKLTSEDVDVAGFPLFSFFTLAMGMSSVIPDIDFAAPSKVDPAKLYRNIIKTNATFLAGSPSIWEKLADYCLENKLKLDHVKYLVMFGAPVRVDLHRRLSKILVDGTSYTPYGATECLPVSNVSGREILRELQEDILNGEGTCVGKPLNGVHVKIIKSSFDEIVNLEDAKELAIGEIGEIIVSSPNVTKKYFNNESATKISKIKDGNKTWHRMGDVGHLDKKGRLWFCGRQKHVVTVGTNHYYPNQVETIFNSHPQVSKSALVLDLEENQPAIVIERKDHRTELDPMFLVDLKNLAQTNIKTKDIQKFYVQERFPVDVRHNIKIDRGLLQRLVNHA